MNDRARWGWRILVTIGALLVLNGVALYAFIVDTLVEQTVGVLLAAFGALTVAVALEGLRHGSQRAWRASWIVVIALLAVGLHTLQEGRADIPATYLGLAAAALVGQLLSRKAA